MSKKQTIRPEHVPRHFFKEVRNGNLDNAAHYLSIMIHTHLCRYPDNDDMLTIFISCHLASALDLAGYLELRTLEPMEPIIQAEIQVYHQEYPDDPHALLILAQKILHRIWIVSGLNAAIHPPLVHQMQSLPVGRIQLVRSYVDEHYADPSLTVTYLAEHFGFSISYLSRIFHQLTGIKLADYILSVRFQAAKQLLRNTECPVAEVAAACGFSCSSTFIRIYRVKEGVTPGSYRRFFEKKRSKNTHSIS